MAKYALDQLLVLASLSFELYVEKYNSSSNLKYSIAPKENKNKIHAVANQIKMSTGTAENYSERLFNLFNELNEFNLNNGLPSCQGELRVAGIEVFEKSHFIKRAISNESSHDDEFKKRIKHSLKLSYEDRLKELDNAPKLPQSVEVTTRRFIRNANVVVEVLNRADGNCEKCSAKAPFFRSKDRTPYLEVHHVITLADGGEDTVDNAMAVCPNCHREMHYG